MAERGRTLAPLFTENNLQIMLIFNVLKSMFTNKCPRCHSGDVFVQNNPYRLKSMFKVHSNCSHCNLKYEKEPSFFYGSLYVSYALTSGWFIIFFVIQSYLLHWSGWNAITFFCIFIILVSPLTLRWSRMLWLNFFFTFHPELKQPKKQSKLQSFQ